MKSFFLAIKIFSSLWGAARAHWFRWTIFWLITTIFINIVFQFSNEVVLVYMTHFSFPIFLLGIYSINKDFENEKPRGLRAFFDWLRYKRLLSQSILLSLLHLLFYLALALLGMFLGEFVDSSPVLLVMFLVALLFLAITWRAPALIFDGDSFLEAIRESVCSFLMHWKPTLWLLFFIHIPMLFLIYGVYECMLYLNTLNDTIINNFLSLEDIVSLLFHNSTLYVSIALFGAIFQMTFWLTILYQGYSPTLWNFFPKKSKALNNYHEQT